MSDMTQKVGRIRRITESIITLPTLPTVVSKMIQLVDNPKTSAGSLARLISSDQAMTARMLKTANSAYYGFSREISTVDMAIVVMGFDAVKEIGLSLSVLEMFRNAGPDTPFDVTRFWEHSVGCAVASRMLARRYRRDVAGEAFVAGLLHDIGKLILSQYATRDFTNIMELVAHDEATLDEAEQTVLGAGHPEVGGWLAEKWRLPRKIVEGIRRHHAVDEARADPALTAVVSLGNYLCHRGNVGASGRKHVVPPGSEVWAALQEENIEVDEQSLDEFETDFLLAFDQAETFISLIHEE